MLSRNRFISFYAFVTRVVNRITEEPRFFYNRVLAFLLLSFLCQRLPGVYSPLSLFCYLVFMLSNMLMYAWVSRLYYTPLEFIGQIVPTDLPVGWAPAIGLVECVSLLLRPLVLLMRAYANLGFGFTASAYLFYCLVEGKTWVFVLLVVWVVYEIFVAVVQWYVICVIVWFSRNV